MGKIKGGSSHDVNQAFGRRKMLEWQAGYGVVSFGTRRLDWVLRYVRNQREHHRRGTVHDRLERITQDDEGAGFGAQAVAAGSPVNGPR